MSDVRIVPLCAGTARRRRQGLVMGGDDTEIELSCTMFYVRAGGVHVVVDTGVPPAGETPEHHHPMARAPEHDPVAALEQIGIDAGAIDIVVNTHLHWDHCANNHRFPNARRFAQRSELQYAIAPLPLHRQAYDGVEVTGGRCHYLPGFLVAPLTLVDGDRDIAPGIRLLHTPGHSPGSQSVLVRGHRDYLIAGDNVPILDNLAGEAHPWFTPNPIHVDLEAYYRSVARSVEHADVVLPGHDMRVFDQDHYS